MGTTPPLAPLAVLVALAACHDQRPAAPATSPKRAVATEPRPVDAEHVRELVGRLDLERYKATLKGLTQFGDRQQGTDRNRRALDWIEAQLRSYGCTNTERLAYDYRPPAQPPAKRAPSPTAAGGGRARGVVTKTGVNDDPNRQRDAKIREL